MSTETILKPKQTERQPKPKWLRVKLPTGKKYTELRGLVDKYKLNTICTSGSCPNMGECWGEGTATFMILGNVCTRSCGFCGVKTGRPETVDWDEPEKVARSIKIMNIKHAVLTSVDRDDLKDMGSIMWAETVKSVRRMNPQTTMETLIPDFQGLEKHIDLLSIDIDGNDIIVAEAILEKFKPRVLIVEFEKRLGFTHSVYQSNRDDFNRHFSQSGTVSLAAWHKMLSKYGYSLVALNNTCFNAFFVSDNANQNRLESISPKQAYEKVHIFKSVPSEFWLEPDSTWNKY